MGARGTLRLYLGAAPGVGKTFAMLDEGHRRRARGTDVVVGWVDDHGRPNTRAQIGDLEVLARRRMTYRGTELEELDLDALLARKPSVALVDELAHTNVPGSRNEKRWQDVEELLDAGIDVISTVNIQHLSSLNDVVERITGIKQLETIPDDIARRAEQIELVDMTPEALRRRMAHGNIYPAERVDAALSNYFRVGNLTALRELALLWLADRVDEGLARYRESHHIDSTWETRERVVVAITGGPEGETLIRRAARIAARGGADMQAVHIARSDGLADAPVTALEQQRVLVESLGGTYHSVVGDDVPRALLDFAKANNATQIVLGASSRSWFQSVFTGPGVGATVTRLSGAIDVHMVSHEYVGRRGLPRLTGGLTAARRWSGLALDLVSLPLLTLVLTLSRTGLSLGSVLLLYLLLVVIIALVGGFYPAILAAIAASLLINYYFVPPIHTFTITEGENALAVLIFVLVAVLVSSAVDYAARRTTQAARARAEAETLATLAGSVLRGEQALPALLERVRETFGATAASLLHTDGAGGWTVVESLGPEPPRRVEEATAEARVGEELALALRGRALPASDQRLLVAFAAQIAVAWERRELATAASRAGEIQAADRMRSALLNAVSHDLRTPLASIKAAITSLRSEDVSWDAETERELLAGADHEIDRLNDLLGNLLDLSRLEAGALNLSLGSTSLEEVISSALHAVHAGESVDVDLEPGLPEAVADPVLLERVLANLIDNALRFQPAGKRVRVAASSYGKIVEVRVIDSGPGIRPEEREAVFEAFQRRDDRESRAGAGVGLGLAIARGFTEAMGGALTIDDTPGGGLTMVVTMQQAEGHVG